MKVLVATDLTARSDRALARAFVLAREMKGVLTIAHIVQEELPDDLRDHTVEWAKRNLAGEIAELTKTTGVVPSVEICVGSARRDIPRLAESSMADLIVIGIHDVRKNTAFSKTTAGGILSASSKATLIVKCDVVAPYKQVIVGTDFSSHSRATLKGALAVAPEAYFSLVHAYRIPFQAFLGTPAFRKQTLGDLQLELDAFLATEMDAPEPRLRSGLFNTIIEEGDPSRVIREVLGRVGSELIAVGTSRSADALRTVWVSPIAGLFNQLPCDLLVV